MRHKLYRAFPHRRGEGGGGHGTAPAVADLDDPNQRAIARAQLRRELRVIRRVDMFAQLAAHAERQRLAAAAGYKLSGFRVTLSAVESTRAGRTRSRRSPGFSALLQKGISAANSLPSQHHQRPASTSTPRHPQLSIPEPRALHRDRHRTPYRVPCRARVPKPHRVLRSRIDRFHNGLAHANDSDAAFPLRKAAPHRCKMRPCIVKTV